MVVGDRFVKSLAVYHLRPSLFSFFCLRARPNVRAKERRVNPIFLVQLRKMLAEDFPGSMRMKNSGRNGSLSRLQGLASICRKARREKTAGAGRLDVHRACTGNAESSSRFPVLSSQFSVLSSQFSVLSSRFSVLSSQLRKQKRAGSDPARRSWTSYCELLTA